MTRPIIGMPISKTGRNAPDVAIDAARRAGRIIRDRFLTAKEISFKGGKANVVTDVDLEAEKAVLDLLQAEYPGFSILSEESPPMETGSRFTWVIDPLDGTRNYAGGIPHFCVVVALALAGNVILGVTYDPMRAELFTAASGHGAFLNGSPISVSTRDEMPQALLAFDLGFVDERAGQALDMVRSLWPGIQSVRLMGSSALGLAYTAAGRVDLYFHHSLSPWDIAAGLLLVQEAGGTVVDRQGHPAGLQTPSIIASNPRLLERFLQKTDGLAWRNG